MSKVLKHQFIDTMCKSHGRKHFIYFLLKHGHFTRITNSNYFGILETEIFIKDISQCSEN